MAVAVVTLNIALPGVSSLKGKRRLVKSLKDRLRNRFNVAVSETDHQDVWQTATLAVCTISGDAGYAESTVSKVADYVRSDRTLSLTNYEVEVF